MLKIIFEPVLNFLFPESEHTNTIKNYSAEELLTFLPRCEKTDPGITCLFRYQDETVKHLVWEIKYYRNKKVADNIGKLLALKICACTQPEQKYILIPIPITEKRLRERGFNHTELIARSVLNYLPQNFQIEQNAVKKIRHTPKQNSVEHREERLRNLVGAFSVSNISLIKNKKIIIIDDVVTTGATVNEARKILLENRATSVHVFAIAH